jgi:hypothetical protein
LVLIKSPPLVPKPVAVVVTTTVNPTVKVEKPVIVSFVDSILTVGIKMKIALIGKQKTH